MQARPGTPAAASLETAIVELELRRSAVYNIGSAPRMYWRIGLSRRRPRALPGVQQRHMRGVPFLPCALNGIRTGQKITPHDPALGTYHGYPI